MKYTLPRCNLALWRWLGSLGASYHHCGPEKDSGGWKGFLIITMCVCVCFNSYLQARNICLVSDTRTLFVIRMVNGKVLDNLDFGDFTLALILDQQKYLKRQSNQSTAS